MYAVIELFIWFIIIPIFCCGCFVVVVVVVDVVVDLDGGLLFETNVPKVQKNNNFKSDKGVFKWYDIMI